MDIQKEYKLYQIELDTFTVPARVLVMDDAKEIEDELAVFAKEKSMITQSQYEDFILSTFVVNIGAIVYFAIQSKVKNDQLVEMRGELLDLVYETNPELVPENLIVNSSGVLKLVDDGIVGMQLVDMESWEKDTSNGVVLNPDYLYNFGSNNVPTEIQEPTETDPNNTGFNEVMQEAIRKVNKLECFYKKVWWDRIVSYITIKTFDKSVVKDVVSAGTYKDQETYEMFLVTVLVLSIEDVFSFVESQGLLTKFTPQQIIHEIYELCIKVNPALDYKKLDKKRHQAGKKCKVTQKKSEKTLDDISLDAIVGLEKAMKSKVIGQNEAISTITRAVKRAKVGLKRPEKPIGTFLFTGSTGVGKTLTAKVLHDYLMGKDGAFVRIDCSEYTADHEYSKLIGSPQGYVGYDDGGHLTNKLIENPFAVVLFDEIEKASPKVHQLLLQVMDDGIITDNKGTEISFKDTIIIMTSNVGVEKIEAIRNRIGFGNVNVVNEENKADELGKAVKETFKPEFINRIDEIVHFKGIDRKACREIINLELQYVKDLLESKNIIVDFSTGVKNLIFKHGYSEEYGAREIKRTIEKRVSDSMADFLIDTGVLQSVILDTRVKNGKVVFKHTLFDDVLKDMFKKDTKPADKNKCAPKK